MDFIEGLFSVLNKREAAFPLNLAEISIELCSLGISPHTTSHFPLQALYKPWIKTLNSINRRTQATRHPAWAGGKQEGVGGMQRLQEPGICGKQAILKTSSNSQNPQHILLINPSNLNGQGFNGKEALVIIYPPPSAEAVPMANAATAVVFSCQSNMSAQERVLLQTPGNPLPSSQPHLLREKPGPRECSPSLPGLWRAWIKARVQAHLCFYVRNTPAF